MKPIQLTVQAFGSYKEKTVIDFEKPKQNLFLVTGDTGAGKSTIFDALVFSLYGEASSSENKKTGMELQSQYSDYSQPPYVELVFSEKTGDKEDLYTVKRIPKHQAAYRNRKREGQNREIGESVTLIMPNNEPYIGSIKETNSKITELIGLTKAQFMQVAMIAQGEFMELLRADSNSKKLIFRKLFGTEKYQSITVSLQDRLREQRGQILKIKTTIQNEIAHLSLTNLPENEELYRLQLSILQSESFSVVEVEQLLELLKDLCSREEELVALSQRMLEEAEMKANKALETFLRGQTLQIAYETADKAVEALKKLEVQAALMQNSRQLAEKIKAAYTLFASWQRMDDRSRKLTETRSRIEAQLIRLPFLEKEEQEAIEEDQACKEVEKQALADYARILQKVNEAMEIFEKIKESHKTAALLVTEEKKAEMQVEAAQQAITDIEKREKAYRAKCDSLSGREQELLLLRMNMERCKALQKGTEDIRKKRQEVVSAQHRFHAAKDNYLRIRENYTLAEKEYVVWQNMYFDAQAGLIAREKLQPCKPCPVCGSIDHPAPCLLKPEHKNLTREAIEEKKAAKDILLDKQQAAAGEAREKKETLQNLIAFCQESEDKLRNEIKSFDNMLTELPLDQIGEYLHKAFESQQEQENKLRQEFMLCKKLKDELMGMDTQKEKLQSVYAQSEALRGRIKEKLAVVNAEAQSLRGQLTFRDEVQAEIVCKQAEEKKKRAVEARIRAEEKARHISKALQETRALLQQAQLDAPVLEDEYRYCQEAYMELLHKLELTEEEWQSIKASHKAEETEVIRNQLDAYHREKALLQGRLHTSEEVIKGSERPDILLLSREKDRTEQFVKECRDIAGKKKEAYHANLGVLTQLNPCMEERRKAMEVYNRLEMLYNRLSGKTSGARMDIETFVQRYYLEKILIAANRRFTEMSAGQFELRMIDTEKAGEGKNHGLDFMVYSCVTGKEREIRTLSGGESFLAALSLALGMADQIQESSASIHLDIMFIDEGFGSLDGYARAKAVRVLKRMADGSRLIGIISHVTELKQEIEDRLLVTKNDQGSHIEWSIS